MRAIHRWTDDTATICVQGLDRPVRMLQISDSHLRLIDDRDDHYLKGFDEENLEIVSIF